MDMYLYLVKNNRVGRRFHKTFCYIEQVIWRVGTRRSRCAHYFCTQPAQHALLLHKRVYCSFAHIAHIAVMGSNCTHDTLQLLFKENDGAIKG